MKRRTYLRALIWIAPAVILAGYAGYHHIRESLLRSAVEEAIARASGGSCSIGRALIKEDRIYFGRLELRHPSGLKIECEDAVVPLSGWPLDPKGLGRIDALNVTVALEDIPPVRIDKVNVLREQDKKSGQVVSTVMIASECAGLNAALEKRAKVRFAAGKFEIYSRPDLDAKQLNFPVLVRLLEFKVRGTAGKFEVEAAEVRATARVTGTRENPRVDLGELEPYLSGDFVEGFKDLAE